MNVQSGNKDVIVSVIVPTRNRPELLTICLDGIAKQDFSNYEVLVVDDGSSYVNQEAYTDLVNSYGEHFNYLSLSPPGSRGAGPSVTRNFGIENAKGRYLAFCDDDDFWCSPDHLQVAVWSLESEDADLYYSNMNILSPDGDVIQEVHMRDVLNRARSMREIDGQDDVYRLSRADILCGSNYAHLNITVVSSELAKKSGGFWEYSNYAEDVDFFVRMCDGAKGILYRRKLCASHNAPAKRKQLSASTSIDIWNKRLIELNTNQHTLLNCSTAEAERYVRNSCAILLKMMTEESSGWQAFIFAKLALSYKFGWKWFLYVLFLGFRQNFKS